MKIQGGNFRLFFKMAEVVIIYKFRKITLDYFYLKVVEVANYFYQKCGIDTMSIIVNGCYSMPSIIVNGCYSMPILWIDVSRIYLFSSAYDED